MRTTTNLLFLLLAAWLVYLPAPTRAADATAEYEQVAAIFRQYCLGCHNAKDAEHGLVLESHEALLQGGKDGAVLVPSKSDQSRLLLMLDGRLKPAMPPEGNERPTADDIAIIKAWIDAGAKGPSGQPPDPTVLVTPKVELKASARKVINAAAISPDGKLLALASYGAVRLVSTETREEVRRLSGHRGNVTDLVYSADGSRLLSCAGEPGLFGEVRVWNVQDGTPVQTLVGHSDSLYALALSPDGTLLATGGYDQQIVVWDLAQGTPIRNIVGHNGAIYDLAFHPQGKILASASADRTVKLWEVATGTRLDTLGQSLKELYALAFSPDGRQIVACGVDNRLRVWGISETAKEGTNPLLITRFAHEGALIRLAFASDGKTLVSSADDNTVRIWDVPAYTERHSLPPQSDIAAALTMAPDQTTLVVGRMDGTWTLYNASTGEVIPPARPELAAISPRGIQRGVATRVHFTGKNLLDASGVQVAGGAWTAVPSANQEARSNEVWLDVTPTADLTRGTYRLAIVTPGGASNELAIEVDDLVQLAEQEPNDSASRAMAVSLPAGIWGTLQARGDIDHVSFAARAGQTIVCELSAKRLGSALNGEITLLDARGQVVAVNNDFDGQDDPILAYQVPADGTYSARVQDLALTGSENHFYRLSVGELPLVTGVYPLSASVANEFVFELAGYNLGGSARVSMPTTTPGEQFVALDANRYRSLRPMKVLVVESQEVLEAEPNGDLATATTISAPGTANGRIWSLDRGESDVDLYRFSSKANEPWIIEIEGERRGSPLDSRIEVLDAQGRPVERLLLQAVRDSYLEFRGIDSNSVGLRPKNWEEMELNEFMYLQGEVCKVFRMPQGPDSEIQFYTLGGRRRCYFDTSATSHALDENVYTVEAHSPSETLAPNGLPIFPLYFANDDDAERKLGRDSKLTFVAPADGEYLVRVSDVRGFSQDRFAYRLLIRAPRPDFRVTLADANPSVGALSGRRLTFNAERVDGMDGDISVEFTGLPPGFSVSGPLAIQAGHTSAIAVLNADPTAVQPTAEQNAAVRVMARADVNGQTIEHEVGTLGQITLTPKPTLLVRIEPAELTIAPGTTITAQLKVERNGYDDLITFDVDNLPHGVIVDNIGLSGVLIPAGQTERTIFLTAAKWVSDTSRKIHAVEKNAGGQASAPVTLHVRKPSQVAQTPGS